MKPDTGTLTLLTEPAACLGEYADVPIAFEVNARLVLPINNVGPDGFETLPVEKINVK